MKAFLEFVTAHWYFAIILFGMSMAAITLVTWRILLNLNAGTDLNVFLPPFQEVLNKEGVDGGLKLCQAQQGIIPRKLFVAGLENQKQGLAAMKRGMASIIELEILPDLNYLLPSILAIAKIATMVGLLGTVFSMIGTFQELGEARARVKGADVAATAAASEEEASPEARASTQIGLALFATALGLLTAIPLVFSHVLFKAWVHKFEINMRRASQKLIVLVQTMKPPQPGQAKPGAPAPGAAAAAGRPAEAAATAAAAQPRA